MLRVIGEAEHSRYPVCRGGLDDVLGVVSAQRLLQQAMRGEPFALDRDLQPPVFVPETLSGMELLEHFRASSAELVFVVDEYGEVQGVITVRDVLEAITGEFSTAGRGDAWAVQRDDGSWLFDGLIPVPELKDRLELKELPEEDRGRYNTLAGMIMLLLGRLPDTADKVEWDGWRFEVVDLDGKRVDKVLASALASRRGGARTGAAADAGPRSMSGVDLRAHAGDARRCSTLRHRRSCRRCSISKPRSAGAGAEGVIPAAQSHAIAVACRGRAARRRRRSSAPRAAPAASRFRWSRRSPDDGRALDADGRRLVHWGSTSQDVIDTAMVLLTRRALGAARSRPRRAGRRAARARATRTATRRCSAARCCSRRRSSASASRSRLDRAAVRARGACARPARRRCSCNSAARSARWRRWATSGPRSRARWPSAAACAPRRRLAHAARRLGRARLRGRRAGAARSARSRATCALLAQGEVGEIAEPTGGGRGGSSAMPHKRNPVAAMIALAARSACRSASPRCSARWRRSTNAASATGRPSSPNGRGCSSPRTARRRRWPTRAPGCRSMRGACAPTSTRLRGLVFAEAAAAQLAPRSARRRAQALLEALSRRAVDERRHLASTCCDDAARWRRRRRRDRRRCSTSTRRRRRGAARGTARALRARRAARERAAVAFRRDLPSR